MKYLLIIPFLIYCVVAFGQGQGGGGVSAASVGKYAWLLTGNAGTNSGTNFIGTTDTANFDIRTDNSQRLTVSGTGNVGIGVTSPTLNLMTLGTGAIMYNSSIDGILYQLTFGDTIPTIGQFGNVPHIGLFSGPAIGKHGLFELEDNATFGTHPPLYAVMGVLDNSSHFHYTVSCDTQIVITCTDSLNINSNDYVFNDTNMVFQPHSGGVQRATLSVDADSNALDISNTIRINDGATGLGAVLTSDANGYASWQPPNPFSGGIVYDSIATIGGMATLTAHASNIIVATGAITSVTITLPSSPAAGDIVGITFTQTVATLTYSGGTVIGETLTSVPIGAVQLQFDAARGIWHTI